MAMNPFDFVNDINYKKKDLLKDDIDNQLENEYKAFLVVYVDDRQNSSEDAQ